MLLLVTLVACSRSSPVNRRPHTGSATASAVAGVQTVTIEATDDFRFIPSTIYVHPGKVRIVLVHTGTGAPHNWSLTSFPADFVPLVSGQGQKAEATFTAPSPGKYQFVCTLHVRQGQTGTMVVLPN
ncbi:MAG: blue (type 1) copper domain protein [Jatrophihabitans sp.]|nr:blue (type 1) copper domain protein [Jatrophihabitans sp.]